MGGSVGGCSGTKQRSSQSQRDLSRGGGWDGSLGGTGGFDYWPAQSKRIHYLPQSRHPRMNPTPANLLPACADCNESKLAQVADFAGKRTLHPHFDELGDARWLVVSVEASIPPAINKAAQMWSNEMRK